MSTDIGRAVLHRIFPCVEVADRPLRAGRGQLPQAAFEGKEISVQGRVSGQQGGMRLAKYKNLVLGFEFVGCMLKRIFIVP